MKVVFDTNVLFAAFTARNGLCAQILESVLIEHELFLSNHILVELARHLHGKLGLDQARVDDAINSLLDAAVLVEPVPIPADVVRDPGDAPILGTATSCGAEVLISGDKDLLVLGSYESIPILTPRLFFERFCNPRA